MRKIILILFILVQSFALSKEQILKIYNGNKNVSFIIKLTTKDVLYHAYFTIEKERLAGIYNENISPPILVERKNVVVSIPQEFIADIILVKENLTILKNYDCIHGETTIKRSSSRVLNSQLFGKIKIKNRHILNILKKPFTNKTYPKEIFHYKHDYNDSINASALEGIKEFKSIKNLSVIGDSKIDFNILNEFVNLTELDLSENNLEGVFDFSMMKNLTRLSLRDNRITQLKNLDELTNLESLDLSYNQFNEVSKLDKLTELKSLNLAGNKLKNLNGINGLFLRNLNLARNSLEDKLIVKDLPNLISLNLNHNQLTEVDFQSDFDNLQNLYLEYNQMKEINFNKKFPNLYQLNLTSNQLEKISSLEHMKSLSYLYLNDNKLSKIDNLSKLENLILLRIRKNNFSELNDIAKLTKLEVLNLSFNKFKELSFLENLVNLRNLSFNTNQIKDINILKKCTKLTHLNISNNPITSIEVIKNFKDLYVFTLFNTQVKDISCANKVAVLNIMGLRISSDDLSSFECETLVTDDDNIIYLPKDLYRFHFDFNNKVHLKHAKDHKISNLSFAKFNGDFSFVKDLHACYVLSFLDTNFTDLSLLKKQKNSLERLNLINCKIKDFSFLEDFPLLETIYVSKEDYATVKKKYPKLNIKYIY